MRYARIAILAGLSAMALSCGGGLDKPFPIEWAPELTDALMPGHGGISSGDGVYSVGLPDGRVLFMMGDSFWAPIAEDGTRDPASHMYRNSFIVYDNGKVNSMVGSTEEFRSAAVPPGVTDEWQEWYWPGDGVVSDGKLLVFQHYMYQAEPGMWGFAEKRTRLQEYSLPDIKLLSDKDFPAGITPQGLVFGAAALTDGDYVYAYAQKDLKAEDGKASSVAYAARAKKDEIYDSWEYFTASGWSSDPEGLKPMEGLGDVEISAQFGVFPLRNKFVLVSEQKNIFENKIWAFVADRPEGPWGKGKMICEMPPEDKCFLYNAMPHPEMEKDGKFPISYCVNAADPDDLFKNVDYYRPRFFLVKVKDILK